MGGCTLYVTSRRKIFASLRMRISDVDVTVTLCIQCTSSLSRRAPNIVTRTEKRDMSEASFLSTIKWIRRVCAIRSNFVKSDKLTVSKTRNVPCLTSRRSAEPKSLYGKINNRDCFTHVAIKQIVKRDIVIKY